MGITAPGWRAWFALDRQWLLAGGRTAAVASAVIIEEVRNAEAIEAQQVTRQRKQRKEFYERVTEELMPRVFTRRRSTFVWIDPRNGCCAVDASSSARAEEVIEHLRHCPDEFLLTLLHTQFSPQSAMADWLAGGDAPAGFTIDRDRGTEVSGDEKSAVRYVRHPLKARLLAHLASGKLPDDAPLR